MEIVKIPRGPIRLNAFYWPKKTDRAIVICHGFTGRCDTPQKRIWARTLSDEYAVLSLDFAGCGKSEGSFEDTTISSEVKDLKAALRFLKGLSFRRFGLVGHSLGGVIALCESAKDLDIQAVCTVAAPFDHARYPDAFMTQSQVLRWKTDGFISFRSDQFVFDLKYDFKKDQVLYPMDSVMKKNRCPILLIQGTADELVPSDDATSYANYENVRLVWIPDGDHGLLRQSPEVGRKMLYFFREHL